MIPCSRTFPTHHRPGPRASIPRFGSVKRFTTLCKSKAEQKRGRDTMLKPHCPSIAMKVYTIRLTTKYWLSSFLVIFIGFVVLIVSSHRRRPEASRSLEESGPTDSTVRMPWLCLPIKIQEMIIIIVIGISSIVSRLFGKRYLKVKVGRSVELRSA